MKLIPALAICAVVSPAHAGTIITCEAGKGWSYYYAVGIISPEDAGWREDGMSEGSITLVTIGDDDVDLLIKDSIGIMSAKAQGASVSLLPFTAPFVTVIADYGKAVEMYTFNLDARTLSWSQHKLGDLSQKAHTFVGTCE